jgi:hypothetical protein
LDRRRKAGLRPIREAIVPTPSGTQALVLDAGRTVGSVLGIDQTVAALRRIDTSEEKLADSELVGDRWGTEERFSAALADFGLAGSEGERTIGTLSVLR